VIEYFCLKSSQVVNNNKGKGLKMVAQATVLQAQQRASRLTNLHPRPINVMGRGSSLDVGSGLGRNLEDEFDKVEKESGLKSSGMKMSGGAVEAIAGKTGS
ncbi:hypothetical protein HAX54_016557, partial [Datura stramonium]|nr:hypothetical protein [Datura stramonium]